MRACGLECKTSGPMLWNLHFYQDPGASKEGSLQTLLEVEMETNP